MLVSKHLTSPICPVVGAFVEKKYILSEVPDVFVKVFLLLVSADELIVCIVPEVE